MWSGRLQDTAPETPRSLHMPLFRVPEADKLGVWDVGHIPRIQVSRQRLVECLYVSTPCYLGVDGLTADQVPAWCMQQPINIERPDPELVCLRSLTPSTRGWASGPDRGIAG